MGHAQLNGATRARQQKRSRVVYSSLALEAQCKWALGEETGWMGVGGGWVVVNAQRWLVHWQPAMYWNNSLSCTIGLDVEHDTKWMPADWVDFCTEERGRGMDCRWVNKIKEIETRGRRDILMVSLLETAQWPQDHLPLFSSVRPHYVLRPHHCLLTLWCLIGLIGLNWPW